MLDKLVNRYWIYLVIVIVVVIFIIWFIYGGQECNYIGLKPFNRDSSYPDQIDDQTLAVLELARNYNIDEIFCIDEKLSEIRETKRRLRDQSQTRNLPESIEEIEQIEIFHSDREDSQPGEICIVQSEDSGDFSDSEILEPINLEYPPLNLNNIPSGQSRGEYICRKTLEFIYKKPFEKANPDWLINPRTGHKLELDGYNEELAIAFEYHGGQHYDPNHHFNKKNEQTWQKNRPRYLEGDETSHEYQVYKDRLKVDLCDQNGVYLITISELKYNLHEIPKAIEYYLPENVEYRIYKN